MPPPFKLPPPVPQGVVMDAVVWVVIFWYTDRLGLVGGLDDVIHKPAMQLHAPLERRTVVRGVPWHVLP